jgi:hypothetical protein
MDDVETVHWPIAMAIVVAAGATGVGALLAVVMSAAS